MSIQPFQAQSLTIIQGDSYLNSNGTALTVTKATGAAWPTDLTAYTISFTMTPTARTLLDHPSAATITGTNTAVVQATGASQSVRFDLTSASTATLTPGAHNYNYDVQASLTGGVRATLQTGTVSVTEQVTSG